MSERVTLVCLLKLRPVFDVVVFGLGLFGYVAVCQWKFIRINL